MTASESATLTLFTDKDPEGEWLRLKEPEPRDRPSTATSLRPCTLIERPGGFPMPVELYSWVEDSARARTDGDALLITYTTSWEVE